MIVITEDAYKIVIDSFEAQKNLLFEKFKKIDSLHSKKTETYIVKPSDILCSQVDEDEVGSSPLLNGGNDDQDDDDDNELFQMQEDQQMLGPNESNE